MLLVCTNYALGAFRQFGKSHCLDFKRSLSFATAATVVCALKSELLRQAVVPPNDPELAHRDTEAMNAISKIVKDKILCSHPKMG